MTHVFIVGSKGIPAQYGGFVNAVLIVAATLILYPLMLRAVHSIKLYDDKVARYKQASLAKTIKYSMF